MTSFSGGDSPLSITGSIVGIVALLLSISSIVQALFIYFSAYRNAPAELNRFTSSVSNTIDEKSHRLRATHIPGAVRIQLGSSDHRGRWTEMLQEYYEAHHELDEELWRIRRQAEETSSSFNLNRLLWVFKRKDLEEGVKRVETLRMRKMALALNALTDDVQSLKETLERIESRLPEGSLRLPPLRPPRTPDSGVELAQPLRLYSHSVLGESVTDIVSDALDLI